MLVAVLKLLLISFAFHFYKNRYPKEYEGYSNQLFEYVQNNERLKPVLPYMVKVGYAFIYMYSCCQIFLNKVIRVSNPYVMSVRDKVHDYLVKKNIISDKMCKRDVDTNSSQIKTIVAFFNEGVQISKEELSTRFNEVDVTKYVPTAHYDLVIVSDLCENGRENIVTFSKTPFINSNYELSDIQFFALYLKHNDNNHIINLCEGNKNYYVVGNIINSAFLKYYLINVLKVTIDTSKPFVYTLEVMDHNVSMIYLDEKQSIMIQKDGYKSESEGNNKQENNVVNDILDALEEEVTNEVTNEVETTVKEIVEQNLEKVKLD